MIHPNTELRFISPEVGYGVVAREFIPKGTITWVLDELDREFTPEQFNAFDPAYQEILDTYCFRNNKGNLVLCWDHARYVNHSFNANCLSTAYDFEIAIRDINPGEQLTDDYGYLNINRPFRGIEEGTKRKTVYPDDLVRYHKVWDKKVIAAFPSINKVNQPLAHLLSDVEKDRITKIIAGEDQLTSILSCYYSENLVNNHY
ncbi:MAG: SET domain-containing protein-lysine N-methyltransferase [Cryomorphaceae bacterium]|nr:SET domain-containing protein-lysine N-methyltransferase [Cryomorphaceae bacterium]